jgi:hypothetical protein
MKLDSRLNFVENSNGIINQNISSISYYNNVLVNWRYYSQIKTLKWALDQNDNNNLTKFKSIVLLKIKYLKKEKKKALYRLDIIRLVQEINNLEFCLKAIIQDIEKNKGK